MKREAVKKIIKEENLTSFNLFEDRADSEDEMVIRKDSGKWIVYATNERGGIISGSETVFDREEDALDHFLRRLRALNKVIRSRFE